MTKKKDAPKPPAHRSLCGSVRPAPGAKAVVTYAGNAPCARSASAVSQDLFAPAAAEVAATTVVKTMSVRRSSVHVDARLLSSRAWPVRSSRKNCASAAAETTTTSSR